MIPNSTPPADEKATEQIIIRFEEGLYGFEEVKEYLLLQENEDKTIWSLQAARSPTPTFIVLDPFMIMEGYSPVLSDEDLKALGNPEEEDLCFLCVAALKKRVEDSVVNLKSPVVINVKSRRAKQIILEANDYPIRYGLFSSGN